MLEEQVVSALESEGYYVVSSTLIEEDNEPTLVVRLDEAGERDPATEKGLAYWTRARKTVDSVASAVDPDALVVLGPALPPWRK